MKLGIAFPALNHEDNIDSITQRSQAARQSIPDRSHDSDAMPDMIGNVPRLPWAIVETGFLGRLERPLNVVLERGLYWQQLRKP